MGGISVLSLPGVLYNHVNRLNVRSLQALVSFPLLQPYIWQDPSGFAGESSSTHLRSDYQVIHPSSSKSSLQTPSQYAAVCYMESMQWWGQWIWSARGFDDRIDYTENIRTKQRLLELWGLHFYDITQYHRYDTKVLYDTYLVLLHVASTLFSNGGCTLRHQKSSSSRFLLGLSPTCCPQVTACR